MPLGVLGYPDCLPTLHLIAGNNAEYVKYIKYST